MLSGPATVPAPAPHPSSHPAWRTRAARSARGLALLVALTVLPAPLVLATSSRSATVDATALAVLDAARAQVGDAYLWGGTGPDAWDCSGLTSWAWNGTGGASMPRTSAQQQAWALPVPREQLLPGDLVFWGSPVTHVALYVGDGRVVDASSSRSGVVERGMWSGSVVRYGRVPRDGMPAITPWTPPSPSPVAAPAGDPVEDGPGGPAASPSATAPSATPRATSSSAPVVRPSAPAVVASRRPAVATAAPSASPTPAARPAVTPARPAASPTASPAGDGRYREPRPLVALRSLPARPAAPTARAARATWGARTVTGTTRFTDLGLVREAWRHAGGGLLPSTRAGVVAAGTAVAPSAARVGDVVVYGAAQQLYLYAGSGYMVGVSPSHGGRVTVRRVYEDPSLRLVRLPG